ncbi:MAG: hypothetical protein FJ295_04330 [Planctomycetes bacterium]|nr:hypothetical protein [Planctomycetota bacterium]
MAKKQEVVKLPHEYFPPISFQAAGPDNQTQQSNMIQARQNPAFTFAMALIAEGLCKRADQIVLDYTQSAVAVQFAVDGLPQNAPPRDRQSGDGMLVCLKVLANLKPGERRARQEGKITADFRGQKFILLLFSQGVKTGERVSIKLQPKKNPFGSLEDLGMRDKMREQYKETVNSGKGLTILSAPPGLGLSTTWKFAMEAADRFVRDFVSVEPKEGNEEEIINVNPYRYSVAAGESPDKILPTVLLKQPDAIVLPEIVNKETMRIILRHVVEDEKLAITRIQARDCCEALLRVRQFCEDPAAFAQAVTLVLNQRLIRKLCDCKQAVPAPPQLLQQLGIPPGRVQVLYREWQPPPPDPKAKEPPPVCSKCQGVGYFGRTAIFELMIVNDAIREALVKTPQLEALRQVARKSGVKSIREEGTLLLVKGVTSLPELQRIIQLG